MKQIINLKLVDIDPNVGGDLSELEVREAVETSLQNMCDSGIQYDNVTFTLAKYAFRTSVYGKDKVTITPYVTERFVQENTITIVMGIIVERYEPK